MPKVGFYIFMCLGSKVLEKVLNFHNSIKEPVDLMRNGLFESSKSEEISFLECFKHSPIVKGTKCMLPFQQ